jgi:hypothetical protein
VRGDQTKTLILGGPVFYFLFFIQMREKGKEQTKGMLQRWVFATLNPKRRKEWIIVGNACF